MAYVLNQAASKAPEPEAIEAVAVPAAMEEEETQVSQAQVDIFGRAFFNAARTSNNRAFRKLLPTREEQRMCSEQRQGGYGYNPSDPEAKAAALTKSDRCWKQYMEFMPLNFEALYGGGGLGFPGTAPGRT